MEGVPVVGKGNCVEADDLDLKVDPVQLLREIMLGKVVYKVVNCSEGLSSHESDNLVDTILAVTAYNVGVSCSDLSGLHSRKGEPYSVGDILHLLMTDRGDYTYASVTQKGYKYINVLERHKILQQLADVQSFSSCDYALLTAYRLDTSRSISCRCSWIQHGTKISSTLSGVARLSTVTHVDGIHINKGANVSSLMGSALNAGRETPNIYKDDSYSTKIDKIASSNGDLPPIAMHFGVPEEAAESLCHHLTHDDGHNNIAHTDCISASSSCSSFPLEFTSDLCCTSLNVEPNQSKTDIFKPLIDDYWDTQFATTAFSSSLTGRFIMAQEIGFGNPYRYPLVAPILSLCPSSLYAILHSSISACPSSHQKRSLTAVKSSTIQNSSITYGKHLQNYKRRNDLCLLDSIIIENRRHPIIIIPSGFSSSYLIHKFNIVDMIIHGKFVDKKFTHHEISKMQELEFHGNEARTKGDMFNSIEITHMIRGKKIKFKIVECAYTSRFSEKDWRSIVCVIQNNKWQLNNWPFDSLIHLFLSIRGVCFVYENDKIPAEILSWNIKIIRISRAHRYNDSLIKTEFWNEIEDFVMKNTKHVQHFDFKATLKL